MELFNLTYTTFHLKAIQSLNQHTIIQKCNATKSKTNFRLKSLLLKLHPGKAKTTKTESNPLDHSFSKLYKSH